MTSGSSIASGSSGSFGRDLTDQYATITEAVASHVALASDVSSFVAERAALEREYAAKLQALARKMREKRDKRAMGCTVGGDPAKVWAAEVASRSSLQNYLVGALAASDSVVADHTRLAEGLEKVAGQIGTVARRGDEMRKKHNAFYEKTMSSREHVYSDRLKAKSRYDEHCHDADAQRQKRERAEAESRHVDRAQKAHGEARAEMLDAKNTYLVSIAASTRAKQRYFRDDLPRLQDDLQSLWTLVDRRMVFYLQRYHDAVADSAEAVATKHRRLQSDADQIDITQDQSLFIEFNARRYDEPADFAFEPCQGFFDTAEPPTEASAKTFLQNMLIKKRQAMAELIPLVNSKAKEISGLENLRDAYLDQPGLGDPEEVTDSLLESIRAAIVAETQLSLLEAEVQWISETLGGDLGDSKPHRFKTAKFALPSTCQYCEGKVFGLSGLVCQPCGFVCHPKCEPKVPATCRAAPAQKQGLPDLDVSSRRTSLARSNTSRTTASTASAAASSGQVKRRTLPPPSSSLSAQQRILNAAAGGTEGRKVTAAYAYEATSPDELSMAEHDELEVVEEEEQGSGWMTVRSQKTGRSGLVPANYVVDSDSVGQTDATDEAETVAPSPSPSAVTVRALYAYEAQDASQMTLIAGDEVRLTARGFDFGSGWCEGYEEDTGETRIFPASYVQRI
ncbi:unnamed protein product [Parajaminaea phylloscopi]